MSAATQPLHVLRGILRRLKNKTGAYKDNNANNTSLSPMQHYVLKQHRASIAETCPEKIDAIRQIGVDYFSLQQNIAERSRLHELDAGAEVQLSPKELSRRAAARAGLQLPDLNPDLESDLKR